MMRALTLAVFLTIPADVTAANPPPHAPQNPHPAPPGFVSPGDGFPFKTPGGALPFDTGDYLLGDVQGLVRSRGFFTMSAPAVVGPAFGSHNPLFGHRFRKR